MLQLNLLPDVKKELLHTKIQRNLVISICTFVSVVAGAVVLILGGIMGGQAIQSGLLDDNIKKSNQEIEKKQNDNQLNEYLTVQNQLSQIDSFKAGQLSYSRLFDYLKKLNPAPPNNVRLSSVRILSSQASSSVGSESSTAGSVDVELKGATLDYSALNVFKTTLLLTQLVYSKGADGDVQTVPFCTISAETSSLSDNDKEVNFTFEIACNPAAFDPTSEGPGKGSTSGPELKIPSETTSDADRNIPKSVFDATANPDDDTTTKQKDQQ